MHRAKNLPIYLNGLSIMVADAFGCEIIQTTVSFKSKYYTYPTFLGIKPAPELSQYAYDALARQLIRQRKEFMKATRASSKQGNLFATGWVIAAEEKVMPLVLSDKDNALIKRYQDERMNIKEDDRKITLRAKDKNDIACLYLGKEAGKHARLHAGMNGDQLKKISG